MTALRADSLLLLTSIIWGFAFVAQRVGMDHLGPFAFNAIRFALGAAALLPLRAFLRRRRPQSPSFPSSSRIQRLGGAALAGTVLFTAAGLQQVGLVSTTAGNAGFITSLYVVLVPLLGAFLGKRTGLRTWLGALLAVVGLYILSVGAGFHIASGDLLELAGAFFWAFHILLVAWLVEHMESLDLAIGQFTACALLSLGAAVLFEPHPFAGAPSAAIPLLYGGLLSIGVAYTLQIVAQRFAHPARASIILSMEALFAAFGGVLVLREPVTPRLVVGGSLMLVGMIAAQLDPPAVDSPSPSPPDPE